MPPDTSRGPASAGPAFDLLARITGVLTGAVLVALVLLVCTEAVLRGFANVSLGFAEELTGYAVVMLTFFGAALALRSGSLFQVHFLFERFAPAPRRIVLRLFVVTALVISAVLAWKGYDLMASSLSRGKFAPTVLRTPLWIPQLLLPVGFLLIATFLVEQFLLCGRTSRGED